MTTGVLPVSNIINVSITTTPSGLTEKNVNSLALFTNDPAPSPDAYGIYISASQVAEDYGTSSLTYQMAQNVFAQSPNIRSGKGRLVIIPMLSAVSATAGTFTSASLTSNLAALIAVTSGDLKVTLNSTARNYTGINLSSCTTMADVASVLNSTLAGYATVEATANGIKITSHKVGSTSAVTLGSVSGGTGTDLSGAGYLNQSAGTSVSGANSSGETVLACEARTIGSVGYVPIMTTLNLEDTAISTAAAGIQSMDHLFFAHVASVEDIAGIGTTIKNATDTRTRILLHTGGQTTANLMKAAYAGRGCSVNFTGSMTSQTMNLKTLANVTYDTGISQTIYTQCKTAGVDIYTNYDGVSSVLSSGGNDFFDNPYSDLALKFALETAGFNYLRQTNTKVPQTEKGMDGLKTAYATVMERFVRNGCLAAGSWTSSETFGDPEVFKENIASKGYYIYSAPISEQDTAEREERIAPLVQIAAKRAGAIHSGDVICLIND